MAIDKAIKFVKEASSDKVLRVSCTEFDGKPELLTSFGFTEVEFDDAINMKLVKCQSYEDAEAYQQLRMWFSML